MMTDELKRKVQEKKQRRQELKKQEEHITNLVVVATLEILCLLMGLTLIYRAYMGYLSATGVLAVRIIMIVLGCACVALTALFFAGMKKGKPWGFHALTCLFGAVLFLGIRFGHHIASLLTLIMGEAWRMQLYSVFSTKHLIYGAALVAIIYYICAFVWMFFQNRKLHHSGEKRA
ncbi:MAG: hypothetical protein HFI90_11635 [Clostridia bacterium]|nr:hypothetical protein [Clostridia bacterium]